MRCIWHDMRWDPPRWVGKVQPLFVQYGQCARCGKAKAREVLL